MLIVCPNCATSYQVQASALGAGGRSVRCASCKNTWFATTESMVEEAAMLPVPAGALSQRPAASGEAARDANDFPFSDTMAAVDSSAESPPAILDAPPLVPQDPFAASLESVVHKFDPGLPDRGGTNAPRRARRTEGDRKTKPSHMRQLFSLPVLIVVMLLMLLSALNWRVQMVRHFPQTASLYAAIGLPVNLRGLFFEGVKSRTEMQDGVTVLVVEGTIINLTTRTLEVPRLRLSLRNAAGHEVYAWTALAGKSTLGSGNGLPFRARLASPPPDGRDVIVRFFSRRDVSAGLQ